MGGEDIGWEPGEVVLSSFPMAHVISASHRGKICHQCWGGFDEGQMCRCGVVFYCGEGCLDEGRVEHERECGLDGLVDLPDKLLLLLRIWLRLKEGDVKEEEEGGRCRRWTDLEDHWQELEDEACHLLDILHKQLLAAVGAEVRIHFHHLQVFLLCVLRWLLAGMHLARSGERCKPTVSV